MHVNTPPRRWRAFNKPAKGAALILALLSVAPSAQAVTGGQPTPRSNAPYQVGLHDMNIASYIHQNPKLGLDEVRNSLTCGGTAITQSIIVTAAHCVVTKRGQMDPSGLIVSYMDTLSKENTRDTSNVQKIVVHEQYSTKSGLPVNDIALVFLASPMSSKVTPLRLARGTEDAPGTKARISGWGSTNPTGTIRDQSAALNSGAVTIAPDSACHNSINPKGFTLNKVVFRPLKTHDPSRKTVCAIGVTSTSQVVDSCVGDSGGPLVNTATRSLIGVVSWGRSACGQREPAVYTRISKYADWINEKIR